MVITYVLQAKFCIVNWNTDQKQLIHIAVAIWIWIKLESYHKKRKILKIQTWRTSRIIPHQDKLNCLLFIKPAKSCCKGGSCKGSAFLSTKANLLLLLTTQTNTTQRIVSSSSSRKAEVYHLLEVPRVECFKLYLSERKNSHHLYGHRKKGREQWGELKFLLNHFIEHQKMISFSTWQEAGNQTGYFVNT